MKKMFLALLSLVVVSMFLVGCGTFKAEKPLAGQAIKQVPSKANYQALPNLEKFKQVREMIKLNTYCLQNYLFVANPEYGNECFFRSGMGSITENGVTKNIIGSYACIANPDFSGKENACPQGTRLGYSSSVLGYGCYGPQPFTATCLPGYEIVYDHSQQKLGSNFDYDFGCHLSGFQNAWEYQNPITPCDNSGARMSGGNDGEYCCVYLG